MVDKELWADIDSYPNYQVSNFGEVVNIKYRRYLTPSPNGGGYYRVTLFNEDGGREFYVHQLVARAFLTGYRQGLQVAHIDGHKDNNRLDNFRFRNGRPTLLESPPHINARGRRVRVVETDEVFLSVRDCANWIGGSYSRIYECLRNPGMTHKGLTFEFYD